jgi:hypothetical protein
VGVDGGRESNKRVTGSCWLFIEFVFFIVVALLPVAFVRHGRHHRIAVAVVVVVVFNIVHVAVLMFKYTLILLVRTVLVLVRTLLVIVIILNDASIPLSLAPRVCGFSKFCLSPAFLPEFTNLAFLLLPCCSAFGQPLDHASPDSTSTFFSHV